MTRCSFSWRMPVVLALIASLSACQTPPRAPAAAASPPPPPGEPAGAAAGVDAATRSSAARVVNADREAANKARNHRLIEQGVLQDIAGLEAWDRCTLLGALFGLAQITDPERLARWKATGDAELANREQARKAAGVG